MYSIVANSPQADMLDASLDSWGRHTILEGPAQVAVLEERLLHAQQEIAAQRAQNEAEHRNLELRLAKIEEIVTRADTLRRVGTWAISTVAVVAGIVSTVMALLSR